MRKNQIMSIFSAKITLVALAVVATTVYAVAQHAPGSGPMQMHQQMMQGQGMHGAQQGGHQGGHHGAMPGHRAGVQPTSPGQDAFGAIQEVVQILEADPSTDWSKVNISALREHLIDMNEVTLRAQVAEKTTGAGIEFTVTGEGRTRDAIKRMAIDNLNSRHKTLGDFFSADHIADWQYPVSQMLTTMMIEAGKKNYVDFINGVKDGMTVDQSLAEKFKAAKPRLVQVFGSYLGVQGLR